MTPVETVLEVLDGARKSGTGWMARCPAHEDRKASLSVSEGDDGKALLFCHAGCDFASVTKALPLEAGDLFPPKDTSGKRIVAEYSYTDETGAELFQAVRYEPKDFRQRRREKSGSWEWNLNGTRRVLYRLPELLAGVKVGATVYVVEGEKDCDALRSLGLVATCNPMGAGKWRDEYAQALRGARVVVIADKDEPGHKHAAAVEASLRGTAASVCVVEAAEGKDASDWIAQGATRGDFEKLRGENTEEPRVVTWPELLAKDYPPPVLLLAPWLETRTVNMIHGWRGCGKTRIGHGVAVSVSTGIEIVPGWQPRQTGRVLIVDGELSGHELQKRISALLLSYGIDTGDRLGFLIGRDYPRGLPSLDGPEGRGMLERAIEKHKPDLLILDSASTLLKTADENSSADWQSHQDYLLGLTYHGVSPLIIHHDGKGGTQRGTSKREDILAESIAIKSPEDADETDGTRVLVTYGKHRNFYGREAIPFITELIDGRWRSDEPQENRLAIAARLSAEGKSVRAIAEEMSLSKSAAGRLLARAKRDR